MSPVQREDKPLYPKEWQKVEHYPGFETRQMSEDTFQIRSNTHYTTVNREGYEIFLSKNSSWNTWMQEHNVRLFKREQ